MIKLSAFLSGGETKERHVFLLFICVWLSVTPLFCTALIIPQSQGGTGVKRRSGYAVARAAEPRDALGEFQADWERSNPQCPYIVIHRQQFLAESVFVPHTTMRMNGRKCLDGYSTQVFGDNLNEAYAVVEADNPARELIANVSEIDGLVPLYAYEPNGRLCGNDASNSRFRKGTVLVFLKPDFPANISDWVEVVPGLTYMITMSSVERCVYTLNGVRTASPSPTPATPEPSLYLDDAAAPSEDGILTDDGSDDSTYESPIPDSSESSPSAPVASSAPAATGSTFGQAASPSSGSPTGTPRDGNAACFPADATVQLRDNTQLQMQHLEIGHVIRSAPSLPSHHVSSYNNHFSSVFMFSHRQLSTVHRFISLSTASARNITLSAGHYLFVNDGISTASAVRIGDLLLRDDGVRDRVVCIKSVMRTGLFNPHTTRGTLVVNGIVTTTFTTAVDPNAAQALLTPFRMLHTALGWSCSLFDRGAELLLPFAPKGTSVL